MGLLKKGDKVKMICGKGALNQGDVCTIVFVDEDDLHLPYKLKRADDSICWTSEGYFIPIPKFHIGQRVRIRSWESMDKEFGVNCFGNIAAELSFVGHMRPLCGRTATIESIDEKKVTLKDWNNSEDTGWDFSTDMLEPADEDEKPKFKFGDRVVADVWVGNNREKNQHGTVICTGSCDDVIGVEFDNYIGGHECEARASGRAAKDGHGWFVLCENLELESERFVVGQVYRIEESINDEDWNGSIFKISEIKHATGVCLLTTKPIRGNGPTSFFKGSSLSKSITLLTGKEIGEAIRKWDADHAKKPEPKYNEVKRHAKVGEKIKTITIDGSGAALGKTYEVLEVDDDGWVRVSERGTLTWLRDTQYVVLEGYKPEKKGKRVYSLEQIDEAKKIVLKMIQEFYSKSKGSILFSTNAINPEEGNAYVLEKDISVLKSSRKGKITSVTAEQVSHGISKCSNNDEPNEWIGKCVALCKALDKPIPKFIMDGN